jgi:hypothetical protein
MPLLSFSHPRMLERKSRVLFTFNDAVCAEFHVSKQKFFRLESALLLLPFSSRLCLYQFQPARIF